MCRGSDIPLLKDIRRNDGRYGNKFDGGRRLRNLPRGDHVDRRRRAVNGFIAAAPSVVGVLTEVLIARSLEASMYKIAQGAVYSRCQRFFCSRRAPLTHGSLC
jgi:hypothetical protein